MKKTLFIFTAAVVSVGTVCAQESVRPTFAIGGGFTTPVGSTSNRTDSGWNVRGAAGVNFSPYVGLMVDLGYDSMGISATRLATFGVPDGGVHIFSATLDPVVHLNPKGHVDFYLTGGAGLYHRYVELSQPTVSVAPFFDPFFGYYPVAFGTNQILASYSVNKLGFNGGAGIAVGTKWHGKIFAEARYNRMMLGNDRHTDYVPVTFGFRW